MTLSKETMLQRIKLVFIWLWTNIDPVIALAAAVICSYLGLTDDQFDGRTLSAATLGVLSILAFTLIRERHGRDQVRKSLDQITIYTQEPEADSFFNANIDESDIINDASHDLLITQETGNLIAERHRESIIKFLDKGGRIQMVATTPDLYTASLMALRNDNLNKPDYLVARSNTFMAQISDICQRVNTEKLTVRYCPYPVSTTSVIADPGHSDTSKHKAIVRDAGFRISYESKLAYNVLGSQSPRIYRHISSEFRKLYMASSKFILLTGEPRTGKTTLMETIIRNLNDNEYIFWVLTKAEHSDTERKTRSGFSVHQKNRQTVQYLRKHDGQYRAQEQAVDLWDNIADYILENLQGIRLILIDEIGHLQIRDSSRFLNAIHRLLDEPSITVLATITADDDAARSLSAIKRHYRTETLYLSRENRQEMLAKLESELEHAQRTIRLVSHD